MSSFVVKSRHLSSKRLIPAAIPIATTGPRNGTEKEH
jgi:hypothetical protein